MVSFSVPFSKVERLTSNLRRANFSLCHAFKHRIARTGKYLMLDIVAASFLWVVTLHRSQIVSLTHASAPRIGQKKVSFEFASVSAIILLSALVSLLFLLFDIKACPSISTCHRTYH